MRKALNILAFTGILAYLVAGLGFTSTRMASTECTGIKVNLKDSAGSGFYTQQEIKTKILRDGKGLLGYPVNEINTRELEARLLKSPYLERADVYTSVNGLLNIDVVQRKPIVRIITPAQNSYYLDEQGYILPARGRYSPHVLVANGYFTEGSELNRVIRLDSLENREKYSEWFDILQFAKFIRKDRFWNAQIVQVFLNRNQDFELIPRVGAHQIILGGMENYDLKLRKLKVFYEEGLNYEGWNKYACINLKYKNQIICTKR